MEVVLQVRDFLKYEARLDPERVLYRSIQTGKTIIFDERNKKMIEVDPKTLELRKGNHQLGSIRKSQS